MIDLEKILGCDAQGSINFETIDFLLDKKIENLVYDFLNKHDDSFNFYSDPKSVVKFDFSILISHDINIYPLLEEKVRSSAQRYGEVLTLEENNHMKRFKYNNSKVENVEPFRFNFELKLSRQMKFKGILEDKLPAKQEVTSRNKI